MNRAPGVSIQALYFYSHLPLVSTSNASLQWHPAIDWLANLARGDASGENPYEKILDDEIYISARSPWGASRGDVDVGWVCRDETCAK